MHTFIVFSILFAGCLCSQGWGNQGQDGYGGQSRGIPRQVNSGGWGGAGGPGIDGPQGGWGVNQGRQGAWRGNQGVGGLQRQPGAWGQQGAGGWRNGRSADDGQYGATIIDTPEMYGYEAAIPGAQSRFIGYRSARSGPSGLEQGNQGPSRSGGWPQERQY